jgi:hypothetical protein
VTASAAYRAAAELRRAVPSAQVSELVWQSIVEVRVRWEDALEARAVALHHLPEVKEERCELSGVTGRNQLRVIAYASPRDAVLAVASTALAWDEALAARGQVRTARGRVLEGTSLKAAAATEPIGLAGELRWDAQAALYGPGSLGSALASSPAAELLAVLLGDTLGELPEALSMLGAASKACLAAPDLLRASAAEAMLPAAGDPQAGRLGVSKRPGVPRRPSADGPAAGLRDASSVRDTGPGR